MPKEIISESDGKRRVEETVEVAFDSPGDVVWLQGGDEIHSEGFESEEEILEIGDSLSDTGGIHARTKPRYGDGERIVHMKIIQGMLDRDGTCVVGERTHRHTEVEDVDY